MFLARKKTTDQGVRTDTPLTGEDTTKLMQQNFAYPDPDDPEIQYKIYKKREFYAHKIPPRPNINNYADIKEYRDNICARDFALHEHQAMLTNLINPDTPYRGLLIFHGLGSGKCFSCVFTNSRYRRFTGFLTIL